MGDPHQLPLFSEGPESAPPSGELLQVDTPLEQAIEAYVTSLWRGGASIYTIRAFKSDVRLLAQWAGPDSLIGSFATHDLGRFLHWMLNERGKPCSPKTYARRVTALKNFFGYLYEQGAIPHDPSLALIQRSASSPLPVVLTDPDIDRVLGVTQQLRYMAKEADARPHLLVTLLLQTGVKKGECMALTLADVDRTDPDRPLLWVRYDNPRQHHKERRVALEPDWLLVLDEYVAQRQLSERIFDCTARNLEYVLQGIADMAGVPRRKLSFEVLRWTCAFKDYSSGMEPEHLRQKLGLSRISWRETEAKLQQLAKQRGA